jgi:membrane protease YdiL (CAAX protease family)
MNTNSTFLKRNSLTIYLILTPLISLAIALFLPLPIFIIALLLLLVPSGLAILFAAIGDGRKGVVELLKKLIQWRISLKWYAVTLGLAVGIILAAGVLAYLLGWMPSIQIHVPASSQLIFNAVLILLVAILEELGWRGYALPRLLAHRSPLSSALIIGVLWGILHIGIGLRDGRPWLPTFLVPIGLSVMMTWLFVHTHGNLAMAMLFHFVVDYSPQFLLYRLTTEQNVWTQAIAGLTLALIFMVAFGPNLQRSPVIKSAAVDAGS